MDHVDEDNQKYTGALFLLCYQSFREPFCEYSSWEQEWVVWPLESLQYSEPSFLWTPQRGLVIEVGPADVTPACTASTPLPVPPLSSQDAPVSPSPTTQSS